jgi:hypothetical protein
MADYSYETFPVPQTTDCKDPTNNQRIGCFYTPTTVNLLVDGAVVAQYDMTGISDYKIFTYTFKGDPQMEHKLQLTYEDCWAGYLKQDSVIPDNAAINDNLYVLNGGGKKCSDPSVATGTICTMCNDYALWDKNLKFGSIKITNSDGKETVIQPDTYWSNYFPEIKFK